MAYCIYKTPTVGEICIGALKCKISNCYFFYIATVGRSITIEKAIKKRSKELIQVSMKKSLNYFTSRGANNIFADCI